MKTAVSFLTLFLLSFWSVMVSVEGDSNAESPETDEATAEEAEDDGVIGTIDMLDVAYDGPPGWRMVDRFAGFRYESSGKVQGVGYRYGAAKQAEQLGCFGWAQNTNRGTVVGEVRCPKTLAPIMKDWLQFGPQGSEVDKVQFKDYENTKIKLHFSHFKILPDERITCFPDLPHQCPDFADDYEGEYGDMGCDHGVGADPIAPSCKKAGVGMDDYWKKTRKG